jgi:aryl-phospho-beta-D-glucosidase BglC (GH1 family)
MRCTFTVTAFLFFGGLSWASGLQCNSTFSSVSASEFIQKLQPGWNLGNNLDATPTEGSWNNPPVVASTFDTVKKGGFKSVRLPGTINFRSLKTLQYIMILFLLLILEAK